MKNGHSVKMVVKQRNFCLSIIDLSFLKTLSHVLDQVYSHDSRYVFIITIKIKIHLFEKHNANTNVNNVKFTVNSTS